MFDPEDILGEELYEQYQKYVNLDFRYVNREEVGRDFDAILNAICRRLVRAKVFNKIHQLADPLTAAKFEYYRQVKNMKPHQDYVAMLEERWRAELG